MPEEMILSIESQWQKVLEKTDGIFHEDTVKKWILPAVPVSLEQNELVLAVEDTFQKQYIESRLGALFGDVVHQALGSAYTFRVIIDPEAAAKKNPTQHKKPHLQSPLHPQMILTDESRPRRSPPIPRREASRSRRAAMRTQPRRTLRRR